MSDKIAIYDELAKNFIANGLKCHTHSILHEFYLFLVKKDVIDPRKIDKFGYEYVDDFLEELNNEIDEISD